MNWEILQVSIFCIFIPAVIAVEPLSYVRTYGKREKSVGISRLPERIEVASCLGKCQLTPSCICSRISTTGTGACEVFTNLSHPNVLKHEGFVYYAAAKYKQTLGTQSLALMKPSYQSSTYRLKNVKYTADRANDGNRNVEGFLQPYFAHTKDGPESESFPWWQVDMEEEFVITGVFILNRRNWELFVSAARYCRTRIVKKIIINEIPGSKRIYTLPSAACLENDAAHRLHDIQIRVGHVKLSKKWDNELFDQNAMCGEHVGGGIGDAVVSEFICLPCPLHGRYVSVQIVRFCTECPESDANVLQLAEVDVYGFRHY